MIDQKAYITILGKTDSGQTFRPSNWAQRICGALAQWRCHRLNYSTLLRPSAFEGCPCVYLDPALKTQHPALYEHILQFAKKNQLQILWPSTNANS